jgi:hypothetical protein
LGLPWWREDVAAVVRMQTGVHECYPDIEKSKSRGRLTYTLHLEVPCYEKRCVTVVFDARYTAAGVRVFADGPTRSRHRYEDGSLCMWHPDDLLERRWTPEVGLANLLEMTRRHLFREAYWRETGKWLGPEIHRDEEDKNGSRG